MSIKQVDAKDRTQTQNNNKKVLSQSHLEKTTHEIALRQLQALKEATNQPLKGAGATIKGALLTFSLTLKSTLDKKLKDESTPLLSTMDYLNAISPELKDLQGKCEELVKIIDNLDPAKVERKDLQHIRQKLKEALNSVSYNSKLESDPTLNLSLAPFRSFLDCLAYYFNVEVEGMPAYQSLGQDAISELGLSGKPLSEKIVIAFENIPKEKKSLLWTIKKALKDLLIFLDKYLNLNHRFYNTYEAGNYNAKLGEIIINETPIAFFHGPNRLHDSLEKGQLAWQKHAGISQMQQTLESSEERTAEQLIQRGKIRQSVSRLSKLDIDSDFQDYFLVQSPLNKKAWNIDEEIKKSKAAFSLRGFIAKILLNRNKELPRPFKDPANSLAAPLERVMQQMVLPEKTEDKKHCLQAIILCANGFLTIQNLIEFASLKNTSYLNNSKSIFNQTCNEGIDQGPVMNAVTIAFIRLMETGDLSAEDHEQILGMLLARALTVDDRALVESYRPALKELFAYMEKNKELFVQELRALKPNDMRIAFK